MTGFKAMDALQISAAVESQGDIFYKLISS